MESKYSKKEISDLISWIQSVEDLPEEIQLDGSTYILNVHAWIDEKIEFVSANYPLSVCDDAITRLIKLKNVLR